MEEETIPIGVEDLGIEIKARIVKDPEVEEKKDVRLEFGRPSPPVAYFDLEALDNFIEKLQKLRQVLKEAVE